MGSCGHLRAQHQKPWGEKRGAQSPSEGRAHGMPQCEACRSLEMVSTAMEEIRDEIENSQNDTVSIYFTLSCTFAADNVLSPPVASLWGAPNRWRA